MATQGIERRLVRPALSFAFAMLAYLAIAAPASAIPYFAHEYGFTCQKCHSAIPRLNAFGQAYLDHAYQLPDVTKDRTVFPISTKANLIYASDPDPGTPKAVVDEIEVFLAGTAGSHTNYFVEQYLVDGGFPGATRELWVNERLTGDRSKVPVFLEGGSFTLPLPVDPETYRESNQHYAPFDQVVGSNPFNFFDPKIGVQARIGEMGHGFALDVDALQGHDKQSGIPSDGTDLMLYAQQTSGPFTASTYRYQGRRLDDQIGDRFWRQGYGLVYNEKRVELDAVYQTGHDTSFDGAGTDGRSSSGFAQARYQITPRYFALARYEGTNDPSNGFARDFVGLLGMRVTRNARLTLEDVVVHEPRTKNEFSAQYTVGY